MAPILQMIARAAALASGFSVVGNDSHPLEKRMTYRDNDVMFKLQGQTTRDNFPASIRTGKYTVTNLSVTDGQEPERRMKVNNVHSFDAVRRGQQGFRFQVGRKKSRKVAEFWMSQIAPNKNTFNHNPDELNFAFIGNLELEVPTDNGVVFTRFNDVALAQGNAGGRNNWWFGGKNCRNTDATTVDCDGTDSNGRRLHMKFQRGNGGIDVNEVVVQKSLQLY